MNAAINNPHDKLVKETLSNIEIAKDYLRNYLPENVLKIINLDTLKLKKDSFVDEEMKEFFSDMIYSVSFGEKRGYIYILFEHKSGFDKQTPLQLLAYMIKIWRLHLKQFSLPLPVIVPLVLYHGIDKWSAETKLSALFDNIHKEIASYIPDFSYSLLDLSKYADDEIKGAVISQAMLLLLKNVFKPDFEEKLLNIFDLIGSIEDETALGTIEVLLRYIFSNTKQPLDKIKTILHNSRLKNKEDIVMNLADHLINEGMQRGIQQGMQQGMLQGMQQGMQKITEGIIDILNIKFNSVPAQIITQLNQIKDMDSLMNIHKKSVTANSISEFIEHLDN